MSASISVSPSSLSFSSQLIGSTSSAQSVTLKNTDNATLSLTSINILGTDPGDFAQTNTCGSSLAAGASCTVSVTFKPAAVGTRAATLTVIDNAADSPQAVSLTGSGTGPWQICPHLALRLQTRL